MSIYYHVRYDDENGGFWELVLMKNEFVENLRLFSLRV